MQLLPAVARRLVVLRLACDFGGFGRRRRRGLALALALLARLHLRLPPRLFLRGPLAVLLIAPAAVLFLQALAVETLLLEPLMLGALQRGLCLLLRLALAVQFLLLMARLILEHLALDVGALAAHLDIHGARAALRARELQLRLRFAAQGDLARRGIDVPVIAAVAAPQMGEQLMLRILADHVLRAVDLDPRLIELLQQPIDRYFQDLGELRDRYICHTAAPKPFPLPQTSACVHP